MKIAVSGKGGSGKTTVSALLCRALEARGRTVIAVDADSNANLAYVLGVPDPEKITPLADMEKLIEEKTGAKKGNYGAYFKMNPEVSDIPDRFKHVSGNVNLLVMGSIRRGGAGCACPEYVLIKSLIAYLLLNKDQDMVIDMEAGLEHIGRGVTEKVDVLLVVTQPTQVSCLTASRIHKLAGQIHLKDIFGVGNMISDRADRDYIKRAVKDFDFLTFLPVCPALKECERDGKRVFDIAELRIKADELIDKIGEI